MNPSLGYYLKNKKIKRMKNLIKTIAIIAVMAFSSQSIQAQCGCTGSTSTDVVNDATTGQWLYTIVYTSDGV